MVQLESTRVEALLCPTRAVWFPSGMRQRSKIATTAFNGAAFPRRPCTILMEMCLKAVKVPDWDDFNRTTLEV